MRALTTLQRFAKLAVPADAKDGELLLFPSSYVPSVTMFGRRDADLNAFRRYLFFAGLTILRREGAQEAKLMSSKLAGRVIEQEDSALDEIGERLSISVDQVLNASSVIILRSTGISELRGREPASAPIFFIDFDATQVPKKGMFLKYDELAYRPVVLGFSARVAERMMREYNQAADIAPSELALVYPSLWNSIQDFVNFLEENGWLRFVPPKKVWQFGGPSKEAMDFTAKGEVVAKFLKTEESIKIDGEASRLGERQVELLQIFDSGRIPSDLLFHLKPLAIDRDIANAKKIVDGFAKAKSAETVRNDKIEFFNLTDRAPSGFSVSRVSAVKKLAKTLLPELFEEETNSDEVSDKDKVDVK